MKKVSAFVFRALIAATVISVIVFFLKLASPAESARQELFQTFSLYAIGVTAALFAIHLVCVLIAFLSKSHKHGTIKDPA